MSPSEHSQVIQVAAGLVLLLIGYTMYTKTRLDNFREDLFDLRDELFDYMWKHGLPYSMPAYQHLRDALNGKIRFARKTWLASLWLAVQLTRAEDLRLLDGFRSMILDEIEKVVDPAARSYFRNVYSRMGTRVLDYIFLEGPLWPVARPIKWYLRRRGIAAAQKRMGFPQMAEEAAQLGRPDSPEARTLLGCA